MNKKIKIIEDGFNSNLKNVNVKELEEIVEETIIALNEGSIRVAEKNDKTWVVNEWVKKAILLSFKFRKNKITDTGYTKF